MINYMIFCDDLDMNLGSYFCKSEINFYDFINEHDDLINNYERIYSEEAYLCHVNSIAKKFNKTPFVVVSYTHGSPIRLICNGLPIVCSLNSHLFVNSLFYSTACFVGRELAYELISKGCKTFIGFKEESLVPVNELYHDIFINCESFALKLFFLENVTIGYAFNSMKAYMETQVDRLIEVYNDPFCASFLNANKDALICIGDENIKKEGMFI